jgi:hypothetical protein
MELTQIIPLLFIGEIAIILILYRFVLREWIINKWEDKITEDDGEWLIATLEPLLDEVDARTEVRLEAFRETFLKSFLGTVGNMTREAKKLDPMNNLRSAAKNGDWTTMIVEYLANKSGLNESLANFQLGEAKPKLKKAEEQSGFGKL